MSGTERQRSAVETPTVTRPRACPRRSGRGFAEEELDRGHLPQKVELYKVTYPIRSPKEAFGNPYDPAEQYNKKGSSNKLFSVECAKEQFGRMPNEYRRRHGLEELSEEEDQKLYWDKNRCKNWEQQLIDKARKRGEEVDVLDPKFDVCEGGEPAEVTRARKLAEKDAKAAEE